MVPREHKCGVPDGRAVVLSHKYGWTIELSADDQFAGDDFPVVHTLKPRDGVECEFFTVFQRSGSDDVLVQLRLYDDGRVHVESWRPAVVIAEPGERHAMVGIIPPTQWPNKWEL